MNRLKALILAALCLALSLPAWATGTRSVDADQIKSADHSKTYSLPGATTTLVGDVINETPSGTVNGSNTSFTLSATPVAAGTVELSLDGILLEQGGGADYTLSSTTITMATAPALGQSIRAVYHRQ